ncbi:MAG: right-handed parallel beta-helix repeat-containing protein [Sedimentisphaerales bacterium]|nr:right-handed parallel beta-helix repeat-containing protein [Sedimentisphaerales bacterium]
MSARLDRIIAAVAIIVAMSQQLALADIHYVDAACTTPATPYTSWATAATNIQDAVDEALDGDEVIVTNGNYVLAAHVVINKGITVRSVHGASETTVDGNSSAWRCFYVNHPDAVLDGFLITRGRYVGAPGVVLGGGVYCEGATIRNCVVSNNWTSPQGGGVYCVDGLLENCTVVDNQSGQAGGGVWCSGSIVTNCTISYNVGDEFGGGIYASDSCVLNCTIDWNSSPFANCSGGGVLCVGGSVVTGCKIRNNSAYDVGGGVKCTSSLVTNCTIRGNSANSGAGAYLNAGTIEACVIKANTATATGGGVYGWNGSILRGCTVSNNTANTAGGVHLTECLMEECLLIRNTANSYGGIYCQGGTNQNCFVTANDSEGNGGGGYFDQATTINCVLNLNSAASYGGGGYLVDSLLQNCTISSNSAANGGGIVCHDSTVRNCILYFNHAGTGDNYYNSGLSFAYSYTCAQPLPSGEGNIADDPLFADLESTDYHLTALSLCIDTGDPSGAPNTDIEGNPRPWDGDGMGATNVDMGAYEYLPVLETNEYTIVATAGPFGTVAPSGEVAVVGGQSQLFAAQPNTGYTVATWTLDGLAAQDGGVTYVLRDVRTNHDLTVSFKVAAFAAITNYVKPDSATPVAPYTNWQTAAASIHDAVEAACDGGTVLVTNGVYALDSELLINKAITLRSVNGFEATTIDGNLADYRCVRVNNTNCVVDGFTITRGCFSSGAGIRLSYGGTVQNCRISGNAAGVYGGGVFLDHGGIVADCFLDENVAQYGGGVFVQKEGTVKRCSFSSNVVSKSGGGLYGDGVSITRCTFSENSATNEGGGFYTFDASVTNCSIHANLADVGGGFWASNCIVDGCTVEDNEALCSGGGCAIAGGSLRGTIVRGNNGSMDYGTGDGNSAGGVLCIAAGVIEDCEITVNSGYRGGGVELYLGGEMQHCMVSSNSAQMGGGVSCYVGGALLDCLVTRNSASNYAGGVLCSSGGLVQNCTISKNIAYDGGGGGLYGSWGGTVENTILYWNYSQGQPGANYLNSGVGHAYSYCCTEPSVTGIGNFTNTPGFRSVVSNDYRLALGSACIDAGQENHSLARDLDGNPRPIDGDADGAASWDAGCFEFVPVCPYRAWTRLFGGVSYDHGKAITWYSGNVVLGGSTKSSFAGETNAGLNDCCIARIAAEGERQWTRIWGSAADDHCEGVCASAAGIYAAGSTEGSFDGESNGGGADALLTKYSTAGERLWSRIWGSAANDYCKACALGEDGNVYVVGYTSGAFDGESNAGLSDVFLTKFSLSGSREWTRIWGSAANDQGMGIALSGTGNIYVVGFARGSLDGEIHNGLQDIVLTKFSSHGDKEWTRLVGSSSNDVAHAVALDSQGGVYVLGQTEGAWDGETNSGSSDMVMTKFSSSGEKQWTAIWGSEAYDRCSGLYLDELDNVFAAGFTEGAIDGQVNAGAQDFVLSRLDVMGNRRWTRLWGSEEADLSWSVGLRGDGAGEIYVAGYTYGAWDGQTNAGLSDFCVTKWMDDTSLDDDGDGMHDNWEWLSFDELGRDGSEDYDDDGLLDGQEYDWETDPTRPDSDGDTMKDGAEVLAGTDPLDSSSLFEVTCLGHIGNGENVLRWTSSSNKLYVLEGSSNLLHGFFPVESNIFAEPPENVWTDSVERSSPMFYRIGLQE